MKRILVVGLSLLLIISLAACGANSDENSAMNDMNASYTVAADEEYDMAVEDTAEAEFGASMSKQGSNGNAEPEVQSRKIIKNAYMEIETLEYDNAINTLQNKINGIGGYIERSSVTGKSINRYYETRTANFTLRIPEEQFITFLTDMNTIGNIISESSSGQDITSQYFDTEARVKTLEVQEERLLDILSKAEAIEDVISLERALSDVRYQIESYTSSLKHWDNLVSYATLNVTIYEVVEITETEETPKTLLDKIGSAFRSSMKGIQRFFENLVIFLIGNIPYLIIYIPVIGIIYLIYRKIKNRNKYPVLNSEEEKK